MWATEYHRRNRDNDGTKQEGTRIVHSLLTPGMAECIVVATKGIG